MFNPGDIVQFIGFNSNEPNEFDGPQLPLNTITTVTDTREFTAHPLELFSNWVPFYIKADKGEPNLWHHYSGFRLICKPDPEVAAERAPTTVKITVEELF